MTFRFADHRRSRRNRVTPLQLDACEERILLARIIDVGPGTPIDLNERGDVLYNDAEGRPFLWDHASQTTREIRVPAGYSSVIAVDMNNNGSVTGTLEYNPDHAPLSGSVVEFPAATRTRFFIAADRLPAESGYSNVQFADNSSLPGQTAAVASVKSERNLVEVVLRFPLPSTPVAGDVLRIDHVAVGTLSRGFVWKNGEFSLLPDSPNALKYPRGTGPADYPTHFHDKRLEDISDSEKARALLYSQAVNMGFPGVFPEESIFWRPTSYPFQILDNGDVIGATFSYANLRPAKWSNGVIAVANTEFGNEGRFSTFRLDEPLIVRGPSPTFSDEAFIRSQPNSSPGQPSVFAAQSGPLFYEGIYVGPDPEDVLGDVRFLAESGHLIDMGSVFGSQPSRPIIRSLSSLTRVIQIPAELNPMALGPNLEVVGSKSIPGFPNLADSGAAMWKPGGSVVDLNDLLSAGEDWILSNAIRMNGSKLILGRGINNSISGGGERVYLLSLEKSPSVILPLRQFTHLENSFSGIRQLRLDYTIPEGGEIDQFELSFGTSADSSPGGIASLLTVEVTRQLLSGDGVARNGIPGIQLIDQNGRRLSAEDAFKPGTRRLQIDVRDTVVESAIRDRSVSSVLARANGEWTTYQGITIDKASDSLTIRGAGTTENSIVVSQAGGNVVVNWKTGTQTQSVTVQASSFNRVIIVGGMEDDRLEVSGVTKPTVMKGRHGADTYAYSGQLRTTHEILDDVVDVSGSRPINENRLDFSSFAGPVTVDLRQSASDINSQLGFRLLRTSGAIGTVIGSRFDDTIHGDDLLNVLFGGDGSDTIFGNGGNDVIWGDTTTLASGEANARKWSSVLFGLASGEFRNEGGNWNTVGQGNDTLYGNEGSDFIIGGGGRDTIFGGAGADHLLAEGLVVPSKPAAVLNLKALASEVSTKDWSQSQGLTWLQNWFGSAAIRFVGNSTNTIDGGEDNDVVVGGDARDVITVSPGLMDTVFGQGGDDEIDASSSIGALLFGGTGNDVLKGGTVFSILHGDVGNLGVERISFEKAGNVTPFVTPFGTFNLPLSFTISMGQLASSLAGHGSDTIWGGTGINWVTGGGGAEDLIHLERGFLNVAFGEGLSTVDFEFDYSPLLELAAGLTYIVETGPEQLLTMTKTAERLWGLFSNASVFPKVRTRPSITNSRDIIYGSEELLNFDVLFGEDADDTIIPSRGFQYVSGGSGDDKILIYDRPDRNDVAGMNLLFGDDGDDLIQVSRTNWLANFVFGDGFLPDAKFSLEPKLSLGFEENKPSLLGASMQNKLSVSTGGVVESLSPGDDTILLNWDNPAEVPAPTLSNGGSLFNFVSGGSGDDVIRSTALQQVVFGDAVNLNIGATLDLGFLSKKDIPVHNAAPYVDFGLGVSEEEFRRHQAQAAGSLFLSRSAEVIDKRDTIKDLLQLKGAGDDSIRTTAIQPNVDSFNFHIVTVFGGGGDDSIALENAELDSLVPKVLIAFGEEGDDTLDASGAHFSFLVGAEGDDTLYGAEHVASGNLLIGDSVSLPIEVVPRPPYVIPLKFDLSLAKGTIQFEAGLTFFGDGDDTITARNGFSFLMGNDGDDQLLGGQGVNMIFGDSFNVGTGVMFNTLPLLQSLFLPPNATESRKEAVRKALDIRLPLFAGSGDDRIGLRGILNAAFGGSGNDTIASSEVSLANAVLGNSGNDIIALNGLVNFAAGGLGDDRISSIATIPVANLFFGDDVAGTDLLPRSVRMAMEEWRLPRAHEVIVLPDVFGGRDTITGGAQGFDVLVGNGGDDTINGLDGWNVMAGDELWSIVPPQFQSRSVGAWTSAFGQGVFSIADMFLEGIQSAVAPRQRNTMTGGRGTDVVFGSAGEDIVSTGDGSDFVFGGQGKDTIRSGAGFDYVHGGAGNDVIFGEAGLNLLIGGPASDTITGGDDGNMIFGDDYRRGIALSPAALTSLTSFTMAMLFDSSGDGHDTLTGGRSTDFIVGGLGNDTINGGNGFNVLIGDELRAMNPTSVGIASMLNTTSLMPLSTRVTILDSVFSGLPLLPLNKSDQDVLVGGRDTDILLGGRGQDRLSGNQGVDLLYGGSDTDTLDGGADLDVVLGGAGRDIFRRDRSLLFRRLELETPLLDFLAGIDALL